MEGFIILDKDGKRIEEFKTESEAYNAWTEVRDQGYILATYSIYDIAWTIANDLRYYERYVDVEGYAREMIREINSNVDHPFIDFFISDSDYEYLKNEVEDHLKAEFDCEEVA
jgi:hypothetical protein